MTDNAIITLPAFRAAELVKAAEAWRRNPSTDKAARMATLITEQLKPVPTLDHTQTNFFTAIDGK